MKYKKILIIIIIIFLIIFSYITYKNQSIKSDLTQPRLEKKINNYLEENIVNSSSGGKIFCSHKFLGAEEKIYKIHAYLWIICQKYYLTENSIKKGSGISEPIALILKNNDQNYIIIGDKQPIDVGWGYSSIKKIFPFMCRKKISSIHSGHSKVVPDLISEIEEKARMHYKLPIGPP